MAKSSRSWFLVGLYLDILPSFHTLLCAWFAESTKTGAPVVVYKSANISLFWLFFSLSRPLNLAQSYFLLNKVVLAQGDGQRCVCKKIAYSGKRKKTIMFWYRATDQRRTGTDVCTFYTSQSSGVRERERDEKNIARIEPM